MVSAYAIKVWDRGVVYLDGNGRISADSTFDVDGTLYGSGVVDARVTNSGSVSVGSIDYAAEPPVPVPGELSAYSYTQTANGWLEVDLAGAAAGQFDALHVEEEASLGGQLWVELAEEFEPKAGDAFEILTADSLGGTRFDDYRLPDLTEMLMWDVDYSATAVTLRVLSVADFDGNGQVDGADLDAWTAGFGLGGGAAHEQGDADGDGDTDGGDFLVWQRQVGSGATLAHAVPEPGKAIMSLVAEAFCIATGRARTATFRRQRRRPFAWARIW
jgi:hypothetical protein